MYNWRHLREGKVEQPHRAVQWNGAYANMAIGFGCSWCVVRGLIAISFFRPNDEFLNVFSCVPTRRFGFNRAHREFIMLNSSAARKKNLVFVWIDGVGSSCHWIEVMANSNEFSALATNHCGTTCTHVPMSRYMQHAGLASWITRAPYAALRVRVQSTY